jgi:hypothetical protein
LEILSLFFVTDQGERNGKLEKKETQEMFGKPRTNQHKKEFYEKVLKIILFYDAIMVARPLAWLAG